MSAPFHEGAVGVLIDYFHIPLGEIGRYSLELLALLKILFDENIVVKRWFDLQSPSHAALTKFLLALQKFREEFSKSTQRGSSQGACTCERIDVTNRIKLSSRIPF